MLRYMTNKLRMLASQNLFLFHADSFIQNRRYDVLDNSLPVGAGTNSVKWVNLFS